MRAVEAARWALDLRESLGVLRRRWWVVVLAALAAMASALIYAGLQAPVYRATARLEVSARFDNGQQLALERLIPQLAERVRTGDLAREVDARLRLDLGADAILARLRTEPVVQSAQIHLEVEDLDPGRAEAIVFESARVFEEQHAARNQGVPSQDRAIVSILDRPAPARLIWPQTRAIAAAALVLGLLVGAALAFGLDYLDDTLKTSLDVERALGLVTLARLPAGLGLLGPSLSSSDRPIDRAGVAPTGAAERSA